MRKGGGIAGILQHNGAARDLERSNITDVALRNRERLQPSEHKRPAFLSSEDEEVFNAYYRKVSRRSKALNTCDTDTLDERNRRRAAEILDKRYMSSESNAWGLGPESSAAHSIEDDEEIRELSCQHPADETIATDPYTTQTNRVTYTNVADERGCKELAYEALFRPIVEYASCVWDPHTNGNINKLVHEKVQRRAARFVLNRHRNTLSVSSMLDQLQRAPLQDRRRSSIRLTMLYKIQHGQASVRSDALKPLADSNRRSRIGHSHQFQHINCRTDYRLHSSFPPPPPVPSVTGMQPDGTVQSPFTTEWGLYSGEAETVVPGTKPRRPPPQAKSASARALNLAPDDVYCLDTCPENGMEDDDMVECCLCRRTAHKAWLKPELSGANPICLPGGKARGKADWSGIPGVDGVGEDRCGTHVVWGAGDYIFMFNQKIEKLFFMRLVFGEAVGGLKDVGGGLLAGASVRGGFRSGPGGTPHVVHMRAEVPGVPDGGKPGQFECLTRERGRGRLPCGHGREKAERSS
ncbi:Hypp8334 [Branchiostoma lanceolatum]|uniref:Hypp8334 protein n=1 Tax=Branchiostoma lanceolatum TaxID=7740 RepID=A0A8J9Z6N9_BRALA|nr:Hypp8334 [Branchiostoma lanceolatum]